MTERVKRVGSSKKRYLLISIGAILVYFINLGLNLTLMPALEDWMRTHGVLLNIVDAQPPHVSTDEKGRTQEHPITRGYRTRLFFAQFSFPILTCLTAGIVLGSFATSHWIRSSLLFAGVYSFAPFLIPPWMLLMLFEGFDAATPFVIWLQLSESFAIIAAATITGAGIGSRIVKVRRRGSIAL